MIMEKKLFQMFVRILLSWKSEYFNCAFCHFELKRYEYSYIIYIEMETENSK